jgi:hypothetical protein
VLSVIFGGLLALARLSSSWLLSSLAWGYIAGEDAPLPARVEGHRLDHYRQHQQGHQGSHHPQRIDPEEYSQPPYDGRLRFTKALAVSAFSHSA